MIENRKLKLRVRDLEKKLSRVGLAGGVEGAQNNGDDPEISKDLNSDKVMRNMIALIRKVDREKSDAGESLKKLKKEY